MILSHYPMWERTVESGAFSRSEVAFTEIAILTGGYEVREVV
jgi:hypothetical protein